MKTTEKITQSTVVQPLTQAELNLSEIERVSPRTFSNWVRVLRQNWRQGTVRVKGRSDVSMTNKKPWKQKGTGRARAGSARSPLWRGGGVIFGPQPRTKTLTIPKKQKQRVLQTILHDMLEKQRVIMADWHLLSDKPKTKEAAVMLKDAGLEDKKVVLFLSPDDILMKASFMNVPNVQILYYDQPNAVDLANADYWVTLKKDSDLFKEMVEKWS